MKKYLLVLLTVAFILVPTWAHAASYATTVDFFACFEYDAEGGLDLPECDLPDCGEIPENEFDVFGRGTIVYDIDWDLPAWDKECFWHAGGKGGYCADVEFEDNGWSDCDLWELDCDLGTFALQDAFCGASQEDVVGFITSLPNPYFCPEIGGYILDGDWESGQLDLALTIPILDGCDIDAVHLCIGGELILTADCGPCGEPVPEPMTMVLFGTGLVGLCFRKK